MDNESLEQPTSDSDPEMRRVLDDLLSREPQLERQVRAFVWARESGLAAGRLVLAGGEETPETKALARQLAQAYACVEYVSCSECYGGSG